MKCLAAAIQEAKKWTMRKVEDIITFIKNWGQ